MSKTDDDDELIPGVARAILDYLDGHANPGETLREFVIRRAIETLPPMQIQIPMVVDRSSPEDRAERRVRLSVFFGTAGNG